MTTTTIPTPPQTLETIGQVRTWYPLVWAMLAGPRPTTTDVRGHAGPLTDADLLWAYGNGVSGAPSTEAVLDKLRRPRALAVQAVGWPDYVWQPVYPSVRLAPGALEQASEPDESQGRSIALVVDPTESGRATKPATPQGFLDSAYPLLVADSVGDALEGYVPTQPAGEAARLLKEQTATRTWVDDRTPAVVSLSRPWWPSFRAWVDDHETSIARASEAIAQRVAARLRA